MNFLRKSKRTKGPGEVHEKKAGCEVLEGSLSISLEKKTLTVQLSDPSEDSSIS